MDDLDCPEPIEGNYKPALEPATREAIDVAQYEIHQRYVAMLDPLREMGWPSINALIAKAAPPVPRPKQPVKLCRILDAYATELFEVEAKHYPHGPEFAEWLFSLAVRIEHVLVQWLTKTERLPLGGGLSFHATPAQMRSSIHDALKDKAAGWAGALETQGNTIQPQQAAQPSPSSTRPPVITKGVPMPGDGDSLSARQIIDDFCDRHSCSLDDLADKAGIDRRQVFKIRNGRRVARIAIGALAEVLQVSTKDLKPK
jgi:hypothetical protein